MQDERLAVDLDELRQILLRLLDVDVRVARVAEDAEVAVDANVDARRLEQGGVVRVDPDAALVEQAPDRSVGENHAPILAEWNSVRPLVGSDPRRSRLQAQAAAARLPAAPTRPPARRARDV